MSSYSIGDIISRSYSGFTGVDFLNPANSVNLNRSPDAKNIWKSYNTTQSNMIETRPGYTKIDTFDEESINAFYPIASNKILVHQNEKLSLWDNFPDKHVENVLKTDMNNSESICVLFNDYHYILDGANYLKYDSEEDTVTDVADEAYIPTTTISRTAGYKGGGTTYEDVNCLTGKRINTFCGDGSNTKFYLDVESFDSIDKVIVEDEETTDYTAYPDDGYIEFTTAPIKPGSSSSIYELGADNVKIYFTRNVEGYLNRILNCTKMVVFDNRIFYSGNPDYPNAVFHCSLNDPSYVSDLDYYELGSDNNNIKSLVVGNNILWVFKEENQSKDTVFYMTPSTDTDYGRVYPVSQGNISVGCITEATSYKDNIVYLSKYGLEGITGNVNYEQSVSHKSTLIDSKLINMTDFRSSKMVEYNGYLIVYVDNCIFLADYRQTFSGTNGTEFEWYFWEFNKIVDEEKEPVNISYMKVMYDNLYFSDTKGNIYKLTGTNDNGTAIESYWTTPRDTFGYMNHVKMVNKRGSMLKMKNIQNGKVKIAVSTNKVPEYTFIKEIATNGFTFENEEYWSGDFDNFSFSTGDNTYAVFRAKRKKIIDISLKIYSDEIDKPFGLQAISLEAYLGGYVKRS